MSKSLIDPLAIPELEPIEVIFFAATVRTLTRNGCSVESDRASDTRRMLHSGRPATALPGLLLHPTRDPEVPIIYRVDRLTMAGAIRSGASPPFSVEPRSYRSWSCSMQRKRPPSASNTKCPTCRRKFTAGELPNLQIFLETPELVRAVLCHGAVPSRNRALFR